MSYLVFLLSYYFTLISIIGFGFVFQKIIFNNLSLSHNKLDIYIGFYGLTFLTIISFVSIFFTKHGYLHNILIHSVGFFFGLYFVNKYKKNYLKYIFILSVVSISLLLISKTNEDFSYYHLPFTLYLSENKIIFGMGHLNHGYNLLSSIFFLNSTFYFPIIKFYPFHFPAIFFLIFFNYWILKEISLHPNKLIIFIYTLAFVYFNLSFNRLAEYGTDKPGQLLILIISIKFLDLFLRENDTNETTNKQLALLFPLVAYSLTLKAYFITYSILILLIFFMFGKELFNKINKKFFYKSLFFSFLIFILMVAHYIIATGCIISPIEITCFDSKLFWAREASDIKNLSNWLEQWAKAGASPNFRVENPEEYISSFNWIENWLKKYFILKFPDQLAIYFFSLLITFFCIFTKKKNNWNAKKIKKKIIIFYSLILLICSVWFFNHPALRYGGYSVVFLTLSIPFLYCFSNFSLKKKYLLNIRNLVIIVFIIINLKNILRIDSEFKRDDKFKFSNFPFFSVIETDYTKYLSSEGLNIYSPKGPHCWSTPTPCGSNPDTIKVVKKKGYYFLKRIEQ